MWVIGVTVGALYFAVIPDTSAETTPAISEAEQAQEFRTDYLAVAIFVDGNVTGYFTTRIKGRQLAEIDSARLKALMTDALYRAIYGGNDLDPKAPLAADVKALAASVQDKINKNAGKQLVDDLRLADVTFLTHR